MASETKSPNQTGTTRLSTFNPDLVTAQSRGLIPGRDTFIRAPPQFGKTLPGRNVIAADIDAITSSLFINYSESKKDLRQDGASFRYDREAVNSLDLIPSDDESHCEANV